MITQWRANELCDVEVDEVEGVERPRHKRSKNIQIAYEPACREYAVTSEEVKAVRLNWAASRPTLRHKQPRRCTVAESRANAHPGKHRDLPVSTAYLP